nr:hypothetical protein [Nonomuraea antri]
MRLGQAWHPLRCTLSWLRERLPRLAGMAAEEGCPPPALKPRILLRVTDTPVEGPDRLAGEGTIEQVAADLAELRELGAPTVILDPFHHDPRETLRPEHAWRMLAAVAALRASAE